MTATPYRRDELDDLIAHQLGPVRHTMTAPEPGTLAAAALGGTPERSLTVHLTTFDYRGDADPSASGGIAAVYRDLVADDARNQQVVRRRGCRTSVASIARELTERGVPCPSDVDPDRNRHRTGGAWTLRTVAVILANPRYTGRQVWDRRRTQCGSDRQSHRFAEAGNWTISASAAHPALVSEADFVAAQRVRSTTGDGQRRRYLLSGLIRCAVCGRRLDSHWVHGRPAYRCRHGRTSASYLAGCWPTQDRGADAVTSTVGTLSTTGMMITHAGTTWILTGGDAPSGHDRPAVG